VPSSVGVFLRCDLSFSTAFCSAQGLYTLAAWTPASAGMVSRPSTASAWATSCASPAPVLCWPNTTAVHLSSDYSVQPNNAPALQRCTRRSLCDALAGAPQLFFGLMALAMVGVRFKSDKRDQYLQHGGWFVKVALWLLFTVVAFFLPVGLVNAYGAGPWHACPLAPAKTYTWP